MADLGIADARCRRRQDGHLGVQHVGCLDVTVAGEGPDGDVVAGVADVGQVGDPADVDQDRGLGQPQLHQRQEAVPTGEELGVLAVLRDEGDGLVGGAGPDVVELGGDHVRAPSAAASTDLTMLW